MTTNNADANARNPDLIPTACAPTHDQRASDSAVTLRRLLVQCTALDSEDCSCFAIIALTPEWLERLRAWREQAQALRAAHDDFGYVAFNDSCVDFYENGDDTHGLDEKE